MINGDIYGDELVVEASPSKNAMIAMKVTLYLRTNVEWNQTLGTIHGPKPWHQALGGKGCGQSSRNKPIILEGSATVGLWDPLQTEPPECSTLLFGVAIRLGEFGQVGSSFTTSSHWPSPMLTAMLLLRGKGTQLCRTTKMVLSLTIREYNRMESS